MADEKKIPNEEITDEQANEAAGGFGANYYECKGGCNGTYWGNVPYRVDGKPYCRSCYEKYQQSSLVESNPYAGIEDTPHPKLPLPR